MACSRLACPVWACVPERALKRSESRLWAHMRLCTVVHSHTADNQYYVKLCAVSIPYAHTQGQGTGEGSGGLSLPLWPWWQYVPTGANTDQVEEWGNEQATFRVLYMVFCAYLSTT